jgi:pyrimidine operon attenuation protein/uracil phosphoribosyltransferase
MTTQHQVPADWKVLLDAETISRSLTRISYEILERSETNEKLAVVGIRTAGEFLAKRIYQNLTKITSQTVDFGIVDITLYRDDLGSTANQPVLKGTDLPFRISGARIILVDDVLYTGRTVRSALDAITDFGRPACVELAALVDRGHRELPIRPDYIGKNIPTSRGDSVRIKLSEQGFEDAVYLIEAKKK